MCCFDDFLEHDNILKIKMEYNAKDANLVIFHFINRHPKEGKCKSS